MHHTQGILQKIDLVFSPSSGRNGRLFNRAIRMHYICCWETWTSQCSCGQVLPTLGVTPIRLKSFLFLRSWQTWLYSTTSLLFRVQPTLKVMCLIWLSSTRLMPLQALRYFQCVLRQVIISPFVSTSSLPLLKLNISWGGLHSKSLTPTGLFRSWIGLSGPCTHGLSIACVTLLHVSRRESPCCSSEPVSLASLSLVPSLVLIHPLVDFVQCGQCQEGDICRVLSGRQLKKWGPQEVPLITKRPGRQCVGVLPWRIDCGLIRCSNVQQSMVGCSCPKVFTNGLQRIWSTKPRLLSLSRLTGVFLKNLRPFCCGNPFLSPSLRGMARWILQYSWSCLMGKFCRMRFLLCLLPKPHLCMLPSSGWRRYVVKGFGRALFRSSAGWSCVMLVPPWTLSLLRHLLSLCRPPCCVCAPPPFVLACLHCWTFACGQLGCLKLGARWLLHRSSSQGRAKIALLLTALSLWCLLHWNCWTDFSTKGCGHLFVSSLSLGNKVALVVLMHPSLWWVMSFVFARWDSCPSIQWWCLLVACLLFVDHPPWRWLISCGRFSTCNRWMFCWPSLCCQVFALARLFLGKCMANGTMKLGSLKVVHSRLGSLVSWQGSLGGAEVGLPSEYWLCYVDDVALLLKNSFAAQSALDLTSSWARDLRLKLNVGDDKTAALCGPSGCPSPTPLSVDGVPLPWVTTYRYLGGLLHCAGSVRPMLKDLDLRLTKRTGMFVRWGRASHIAIAILAKLFIIYLEPVALSLLAAVPLNASDLVHIDMLQRKLARMVLGHSKRFQYTFAIAAAWVVFLVRDAPVSTCWPPPACSFWVAFHAHFAL